MHENVGLLFGLVNSNENGYNWVCSVSLIYNEQLAINIPGIFITIIMIMNQNAIIRGSAIKILSILVQKMGFETRRFELKRVWGFP